MGSEAKNQVPAQLIRDTIQKNNLRCELHYFNAPENKKATYSQCSRLYAACLDLSEDEYLISSDVDMCLFKLPISDIIWDKFQILGSDLVPKGQYPVCYCGATVKLWRDTFNLNGKTYQQCLDNLLAGDNCEDYRANRWSVDQEQLYLNVSKTDRFELPRSNGQNQFATKRYDRDDAYLLERLSPDTIDIHMTRPGYEENNFDVIMQVLKYHYPNDDLQWMVDYCEQYKKLL